MDTNVVVKAAHGKGIGKKILDAWFDEKFGLLISNSILLEYEEILNRPKFDFAKWAIANFLYPFETKAILISPRKLHSIIIEDPDDNKFMDCAVEGNAKYIVLDDPPLLKLKEYMGIKIVSSKKFLKLLK